MRTHSNTKNIAAQLHKMALSRGPAMKLPTKLELCEMLGTSTATLHTVLNDLETRKVIYRKRGSGIYVSPTIFRKHISVVLGSYFFRSPGASPFWGMLWGTLQEEAQIRSESGPQDFLFHLAPPAKEGGLRLPDVLVKQVEGGQIDGTLAVGLDKASILWLQERKVPCVGYACEARITVGIDAFALFEQAVECLHAKGCRKIAFWDPYLRLGSDDSPSDSRDNSDFVRSALTKFTLPYCPELRVEFPEMPDVGTARRTLQQQGYFAANAVYGNASAPKPDGIVMDDMMTSGAMRAFEKLNVVPGRDVHIVSSANTGSPVLFGYEDRLTLIEYDPNDIVDLMLSTLDRIMSGDMPETNRIIVNYKVIDRG